MKYFVFIVLMVLVFSCKNQSNNDIKKTSNEITSIKFDEKIHDLGVVSAGEILAYNYTYTNTGKVAFTPDSVLSDCGCVRSEFAKTMVQPEETGIVTVYFNSDGLYGKQFKTIEVFGNLKEPKQIAIFAEVKNEQIQIQY